MISFQRTNRLQLLARCMLRVIVHSTATKVPSKISRIVVVPTGKLGDVVCCTPVLQAIRIHLPQAHLIVAGATRLHKPLLADSGLVDEYLNLEARGAMSRVMDCHADVALVTGPSFTATALLCAANIPLVIAPEVVGGFSPSETRLYRLLKRLIKTYPYRIDAYAPRERLSSLEPIGIFTDDTNKHLGFSGDADKVICEFFIVNKIDVNKDFVVGVSPSAGNKIKEWPEDRFAAIMDHLIAKHNAKVLFIGSSADKEKIQRTRGYMRSGEKTVECSNFNIDELKALIAKLKLFISVDTGPIYIAEAFSIPTIDIVGPVDERVQPPRGPLHRNVVPPQRVRPQLSILNARSYDAEEATRQTLSITVRAVTEEIDKLAQNTVS